MQSRLVRGDLYDDGNDEIPDAFDQQSLRISLQLTLTLIPG